MDARIIELVVACDADHRHSLADVSEPIERRQNSIGPDVTSADRDIGVGNRKRCWIEFKMEIGEYPKLHAAPVIRNQ